MTWRMRFASGAEANAAHAPFNVSCKAPRVEGLAHSGHSTTPPLMSAFGGKADVELTGR
jgi:hypothetical protein